MSKRDYDNYFKSKKHTIKKDLVNTFMLYKHGSKCDFMMSNGYSIILVNSMYTDYVENNKYKDYLFRMFETFSDKNKTSVIETLELETIKDKVNEKNEYDYNKDYAIDYTLLKKIADVIGGKQVNIIDTSKYVSHDITIEVIGKDNQVGYLLPMRRYQKRGKDYEQIRYYV